MSLTKRIIPCLDCKNGRVVKGVKFQNLRDTGSPSELAERYQDEGADEIVILDISATNEERETHYRTIEEVRKVLSIPLGVGGGVRSVDNAQALLEAGADKVAINTQAVTTPKLITDIQNKFGKQCTVVAIDAQKISDSEWTVVTHSGSKDTGLNCIQWCKTVSELGAGEILLTSWDRDGTRSGYDCELLHEVTSAVNIPVIASGGAANPQHLVEAFQAGAHAVLAASIFHDGDYPVQQVKDALSKNSIQVRNDNSFY